MVVLRCVVPRHIVPFRLRHIVPFWFWCRFGFRVPVVSLRSTTGYTLTSLRDAEKYNTQKHPEAGGFIACSRWLRSIATTPPEKRKCHPHTQACCII